MRQCCGLDPVTVHHAGIVTAWSGSRRAGMLLLDRAGHAGPADDSAPYDLADYGDDGCGRRDHAAQVHRLRPEAHRGGVYGFGRERRGCVREPHR